MERYQYNNMRHHQSSPHSFTGMLTWILLGASIFNKTALFRNVSAQPQSSMVRATDLTDGVVMVTVSQGWIGQMESCLSNNNAVVTMTTADDNEDENKHQVANYFYIVYKDPVKLRDTCLVERNVNACYEKTLVLPCDPKTNTATVDVYVVSDRSGTFSKEDVVDKPNMRCFRGHDDIMERSFRHRETFQCKTLASSSITAEESELLTTYPPTCAHIKQQNADARDGDYVIWYHDKLPGGTNHIPMNVHCQDMQRDDGTRPREYINLFYKANNYSSASITDDGTATIIKTVFDKIRFDPLRLTVNIADRSFSTSTPSNGIHWSVYPVTAVPYGTAFSCDGSSQQARMDLRRTGFKVANLNDFTIDGEPDFFKPPNPGYQNYEKGRIIDGNMDNQFVTIMGGGQCGGQYPGPNQIDRPPLLDDNAQKFTLQLALV